MPDREVTFKQCNDFIPTAYSLKIHGCNGWDHNLTHVEARETMMQIANHLGYTCTHRSAKKPEPTPQARQDIAATATLHGMGHIWDGEKWKAPQLVLMSGVGQGFDLVDSLRTRITVLTQQALQQDDTLQRNTEASKKMAYALQAIRDALGMKAGQIVGGRVEDGVLEAVQEVLEQREKWSDALIAVGEAVGKPTGNALTDILPAVQELQQRSEVRARALGRIHDALGIETEVWSEALSAIGELQHQIEERKQLAGVQQRANEAMTSHMLAITLALGLDYKPEGENILPAIEALSANRRVLAESMQLLGKSQGDLYSMIPSAIQEAIQDLSAAKNEINDAWSALSRSGWRHTDKDAAGSLAHTINSALERSSIGNVKDEIDGAFAALKDHGYTPDRGETLGTLIRDAFGAEGVKLRQAAKAVADTWDILRCFGHAQPERGDVLSAAVRIALSCHQDDGAPRYVVDGQAQIEAHKWLGCVILVRKALGMAPPEREADAWTGIPAALEYLKGRAERNQIELDAKWAMGRIAGVQQERERCIGIVKAYQRLMEERAKSTSSSLTYGSAYAMSIASGEIEARIAKADPA